MVVEVDDDFSYTSTSFYSSASNDSLTVTKYDEITGLYANSVLDGTIWKNLCLLVL